MVKVINFNDYEDLYNTLFRLKSELKNDKIVMFLIMVAMSRTKKEAAMEGRRYRPRRKAPAIEELKRIFADTNC